MCLSVKFFFGIKPSYKSGGGHERICSKSELFRAELDPSDDPALSPFDCAQGKLAEWVRRTTFRGAFVYLTV